MEELENVTTKIKNNINEIDTEDKKIIIDIKEPISTQDLMAIESIRRIKNPVKMIGVETVMKDLNICKTIAYRLFQREDFPSINIGKNKQIMILPYMIWKMKKRS